MRIPVMRNQWKALIECSGTDRTAHTNVYVEVTEDKVVLVTTNGTVMFIGSIPIEQVVEPRVMSFLVPIWSVELSMKTKPRGENIFSIYIPGSVDEPHYIWTEPFTPTNATAFPKFIRIVPETVAFGTKEGCWFSAPDLMKCHRAVARWSSQRIFQYTSKETYGPIVIPGLDCFAICCMNKMPEIKLTSETYKPESVLGAMWTNRKK